MVPSAAGRRRADAEAPAVAAEDVQPARAAEAPAAAAVVERALAIAGTAEHSARHGQRSYAARAESAT